jgi:hypothetical protein
MKLQNKRIHTPNIRALSGIWINDPSVRASKNNSCLNRAATVFDLSYRLESVKLLTFLFLWRDGGDISCNRRLILVYFEGLFKKKRRACCIQYVHYVGCVLPFRVDPCIHFLQARFFKPDVVCSTSPPEEATDTEPTFKTVTRCDLHQDMSRSCDSQPIICVGSTVIIMIRMMIIIITTIKWLYICVPTQQPKGQLQSEHEWKKQY